MFVRISSLYIRYYIICKFLYLSKEYIKIIQFQLKLFNSNISYCWPVAQCPKLLLHIRKSLIYFFTFFSFWINSSRICLDLIWLEIRPVWCFLYWKHFLQVVFYNFFVVQTGVWTPASRLSKQYYLIIKEI
jgi:hypothetical protein